MRLTHMAIAATVVLQASVAFAGRPDPVRYPNLVHSWEKLQDARKHVQAAEQAHAQHGTLGGHGAKAVAAIDAAEREIDEAVMFAETHRKPGPAGQVKPKSPLNANPDDVKYPNLGDARLDCEWAIRHVEDAMEYHGPIGSLGGHGEKAREHIRRALAEIREAEVWADTHH